MKIKCWNLICNSSKLLLFHKTVRWQIPPNAADRDAGSPAAAAGFQVSGHRTRSSSPRLHGPNRVAEPRLSWDAEPWVGGWQRSAAAGGQRAGVGLEMCDSREESWRGGMKKQRDTRSDKGMIYTV